MGDRQYNYPMPFVVAGMFGLGGPEVLVVFFGPAIDYFFDRACGWEKQTNLSLLSKVWPWPEPT
jgi:hypothetical protein